MGLKMERKENKGRKEGRKGKIESDKGESIRMVSNGKLSL